MRSLRDTAPPPLSRFLEAYRLSLAAAASAGEAVSREDRFGLQAVAMIAPTWPQDRPLPLTEAVGALANQNGHLPPLAQDLLLQFFAGNALAGALERAAARFRDSDA